MIDPKSAADDLPQLTDPSWWSRSRAGTTPGTPPPGRVEHLELIWDATPLAALDPEDYYDFQVNRPTVSLVDGVSRRIEWPTTRISVARPPGGERDVVLIRGHRAEHALARLLRRADRAVPGARRRAPWSRWAPCWPTRRTPGPRRSPARPTTPSPRDPWGLETSRYEGPTGILGVFQDACVQAGLPAMSFWAAVPHYVSQPPSPRATMALLQRVEEVLEVAVPLGALPQQADDWVKTVDEMAQEDDEVVEYVRSLEERATESDLSQASGDPIAREFERYLRRRGPSGELRAAEPVAPSGQEGPRGATC